MANELPVIEGPPVEIVEKLLEDYGRHHGGEWNSLMRELNRL